VVKLTVEKYLELFGFLDGFQSVALRVANPFGPRQNPLGHQGVVAAILDRIHNGQPISVWGDGSVIRDFFYVRDLARAIYLAATQDTQSKTINIGSGHGMSLNALLGAVRRELGLDFQVRYESGRAFDVKEIYLDTSRAKAELGWTPQTSLGDGLRSTWDFVCGNPKF
jgi:UDP-glucose 4-epimerase